MHIKEIKKEELKNGYTEHLTVGELKKFLSKHNLPDTAKVVVQRVEDIYYEKHGWSVYLKEGDFPSMDEDGNIDKSFMNKYTPAWGCSHYNDDQDILFINLHY